VASSLRDVDTLIALEAASGRRVMPIFQYRFGRGVQQLRHLIAAGVTGPAYVTTVEVAWRRGSKYYADPWRGVWATELGGTLATHAIHMLDTLCYLLGPVANVFARTATRVNPIETEDCAVVSLEMVDGSLVSLMSTTGSAAEIIRFRFCFRNLVAESNLRPYQAGSEPWSFVGDSPEDRARITGTLSTWQPRGEEFERQFADFYETLTRGQALPVTLADTRRATELLTAIYSSARSHTPVALPLEDDSPLYAGWLP
jgi:predicted dehydrogenase